MIVIATVTLMTLFSGMLSAQTIQSRTVLLKGTALPASCTVGELFFDTDAVAGQNLYGCQATNTWVLEGDGAAGTSLKVTATTTVITLSGGNVTINGTTTVISGDATITKNSGTDTGNFYVYVDYNSGSPVRKCIAGTGTSIGNYTVSSGFNGSTCAAGSGYPTGLGIYPRGTVAIASGTFNTTVTDLRGEVQSTVYDAGTGLTLTGNTFAATASSFDATDITKAWWRYIFSAWGAGFSAAGTGFNYSGTCVGTSAADSGAYSTRMSLSGNPCYLFGTIDYGDFLSGGSPKTSTWKWVGGRTSAGSADIYWGWSGSVSNVDDFVGIRYNNAGADYSCVIRGSASDVATATISGATVDTGRHTYIVTSGTSNQIGCAVDSATATVSGTIPSFTTTRSLVGTGAGSTAFFSIEGSWSITR